jgi:glycosyltransferase involved in cell wall biosynthesis
MNILLVAFEFPPLGGAGVQRSMAWAKYLDSYGIHPIVVTTDEVSFLNTMVNPLDRTLLTRLPGNLTIERIPCPRGEAWDASRFEKWFRIFFSRTDPLARWWRANVQKQMPRLLKMHRPQAIYVSLPPFSMALLWLDIARQYGLPLVLDLRDAWSQWAIFPYATPLHYLSMLRFEGRCLNSAQRVICTSEQTRWDLLRVHPGLNAHKIVTITNGYDSDVEDWSLSPRRREDGKFVIGYVGQFYYTPQTRELPMKPWWKKPPHRMLHYTPRLEDWLYRSPLFFFRAVERLLECRPELRTRIHIRFAGIKPDWIDAQAADCGLADIVEFVGYLDHSSAIAFQQSCDCLLVTSSKVVGGEDYSIAGKTFEYLTMRKPILGFVCRGAQKDLLERTGMAVLCDPDRYDESAQTLGALIDGEILLQPNTPFLQSLHRRHLAGKLAEVFLEIDGRGAS